MCQQNRIVLEPLFWMKFIVRTFDIQQSLHYILLQRTRAGLYEMRSHNISSARLSWPTSYVRETYL